METQLLSALQSLESTLKDHIEVVNRYIEIEEKKYDRSEWISLEEASKILGLNNSRGTNKRKLDSAVRRYFIRYTKTRPRTYYREDIIELNRRILEGKAVLYGRHTTKKQ